MPQNNLTLRSDMFRIIRLVAVTALLLAVPATASASPDHTPGSAACFGRFLDVQQKDAATAGLLEARLTSLQPHPRRGDAIHVWLHVQKWNGSGWANQVTADHNRAYIRTQFASVRPGVPGTIRRTWILQEDSGPVMADAQTYPVRVIATLSGTCRGRRFREDEVRDITPSPLPVPPAESSPAPPIP